MKTCSRAIVLGTILVILGAGGRAANAAAYHALLIGINEYESPEIADLRGSHNDVQKMREVLSLRYGFPEDAFTILLDKQATRQGILDAFEELVNRAQPTDVVYVHFSGHGSQVQDLDGDEVDDGRDETIVPCDGRMPGVPDITDDEIGAYVSRLRSKYALIVLDCCHSGTATRDVVLQARSVPPDNRLSLYERPSTRTVTPLESNYVLMTGAANSENALDGPVGPADECYGLFSFALGTTLTEARTALTPREAYDGVEETFERLRTRLNGLRMPTPQLEGPPVLVDEPLFASASQNRGTPTARVHAVEGNRIILAQAAALGAEIGSYWAVFPPGTELIVGNSVAIARVYGVGESDASAEAYPADASIPDGSVAIPVQASAGPSRFSVRFQGLSAEQASDIANLMGGAGSGVTLVTPEDFAQVVFEVSADRCDAFALGGLHRLDSFEFSSVEELASQAMRIIMRSRLSATLGALHNASSNIVLTVQTALPKSASSRSFKAVASGELRAYRFRKAGEPRTAENSLVLEVTSNTDCYITIVDVDSKGGVNVLFPNEFQKSDFYALGMIPGGSTVRIPDSLEDNSAGFNWDCVPPGGIETVQVFATTELAAAETIRGYLKTLAEQSEVLQKGGPKVNVGGGTSTRSATMSAQIETIDDLGLALAQRWLPRSFQVVPTGSSDMQSPAVHADWTTVSLLVLVEE